MNHIYIFYGTAFLLILMALYAFAVSAHWFKKILAVQVLANGISLFLASLAGTLLKTDPIPQALVITGIVVLVSSTAFALGLCLKIEKEEK